MLVPFQSLENQSAPPGVRIVKPIVSMEPLPLSVMVTCNVAPVYSVTGFVGSDTLSNATTGVLAFGTTATTGSNVGSYAITGSGLTADNGDYTFVQAASNATALTINPLAVTLSGARAYDGTLNAASSILTVTNALPGDSVAVDAVIMEFA